MKIAFTSCMDATRVPHQPVWKKIKALGPDVLLLLGDNIYMDWRDLGQSDWRRFIDEKGDRALDEFAHDMHRRYELQANVPEFRELLADLQERRKAVLVTWDDHDFAWNNSLGDAPESHDRHVPKKVKAISRALFLQFRAFLNDPAGGYRPLAEAGTGDPHDWTAADEGIEVFGNLDGPGLAVPFALLDTRWYRTARDANPNSILGGTQARRLMQEVSTPKGLFIVAAGSPLKHHYLLSEQDWESPEDGTYAEFPDLLAMNRRPVLYLAGDIHRNAWGGRINLDGDRPGQVVEILASPAAVDNVWAKKYPPAFGWLEVTSKNNGLGGSVAKTLYCLGPAQVWEASPNTGSDLEFTAEGWTGNIDGEAATEDRFLVPDAAYIEPIAALFCLERRRGVPAGGLARPFDKLAELDDSFEERVTYRGTQDPVSLGWPEPMIAEIVRQDVNQPELKFSSQDTPGDRPAGIRAMMERLFVQAQDKAARTGEQHSVVLFIHGLGKSPVNAVDQACALRAIHPHCEPIVFCWPAGHGNGLLAGYFDAFNARMSASAAVAGLRESLFAFAECARAHPSVASVVLARSGGAGLLGLAIADGARNADLQGIDRIVLSAPAVEASDFRHTNAYSVNPAPPQTVVTINENDRTLDLGKWFSKIGPALGNKVPDAGDRHDRVLYLDFTGGDRIGGLHDYLCVRLSDRQLAINQAMLCGKSFQPDALAELRPGNSANLFHIRT